MQVSGQVIENLSQETFENDRRRGVVTRNWQTAEDSVIGGLESSPEWSRVTRGYQIGEAKLKVGRTIA